MAVPNGASINFAPVGPPPGFPHGRTASQFQIVDDISYSTGNHFLKAGVNYRYNRVADLGFANVSVGNFTLDRMREFANGALKGKGQSNFTQTFNFNPVFHLRLYNFGAYIQDQWAPTPRLKVTATIRFERTSNPYCVNRCFARLAEPFPDLSKGLAIPYNQSIKAGQAHAFYDIEPLIPQPRFGLAYSPGWARGTVFRGGIGLFSDLYPVSFADSVTVEIRPILSIAVDSDRPHQCRRTGIRTGYSSGLSQRLYKRVCRRRYTGTDSASRCSRAVRSAGILFDSINGAQPKVSAMELRDAAAIRG